MHRNKSEAKNAVLIFKIDIRKEKNTLLLWIQQNILENQAFQRIPKLTEMKDIYIYTYIYVYIYIYIYIYIQICSMYI